MGALSCQGLILGIEIAVARKGKRSEAMCMVVKLTMVVEMGVENNVMGYNAIPLGTVKEYREIAVYL